VEWGAEKARNGDWETRRDCYASYQLILQPRSPPDSVHSLVHDSFFSTKIVRSERNSNESGNDAFSVPHSAGVQAGQNGGA
jgi:hypothetical protein